MLLPNDNVPRLVASHISLFNGLGTPLSEMLRSKIPWSLRLSTPSNKKTRPAEIVGFERFSNGNGRNSAVVRELQTTKKECHTHSARRIFLEGSGHVVRSF